MSEKAEKTHPKKDHFKKNVWLLSGEKDIRNERWLKILYKTTAPC